MERAPLPLPSPAMSSVKLGETLCCSICLKSLFGLVSFPAVPGFENVFLASSKRVRCSTCYPCTAPLGTAPIDLFGHGQETSAPNLSNGSSPTQGLGRARAVSNGFGLPSRGVSVAEGGGPAVLVAQHHPTQSLRGRPTGAPAPQIHGELAGNSHDGLLARRFGCFEGAEDGPPFLDQLGLGLPHHQPPRQFDQRGAQAHVAVLGDREQTHTGAAGAEAPAQTGVAADLAPVFEPVPVANFTLDDFIAQAAQAFGPLRWRGRRQPPGRRVQLPSQGFQHAPEHFQPFHQVERQFDLQRLPAWPFPPTSALSVILAQEQAAALGGYPLDFPSQLLALPAFDALEFFLGRRYTHRRHSLAVASHVTIQPLNQLPRVTLIVVDSLAMLVQADGLHYQVPDPQLGQLAVEHKAKGASLVTTIDRVGLGQLALDPLPEITRHEGLGGLGSAVIEHACHDDRVSVNIQAQLDGLILLARGLLRANFGGIEVLFVHNVGGCSASALARQLLMSSLPSDGVRV